MNSKAIIQSTLVALVATIVVGAAATAVAADKLEKCYRNIKAATSDCQTSTHACAGQSANDSDAVTWVYVRKGPCEKIAGGSLGPKG